VRSFFHWFLNLGSLLVSGGIAWAKFSIHCFIVEDKDSVFETMTQWKDAERESVFSFIIHFVSSSNYKAIVPKQQQEKKS
jgi:hypothetical protein